MRSVIVLALVLCIVGIAVEARRLPSLRDWSIQHKARMAARAVTPVACRKQVCETKAGKPCNDDAISPPLACYACLTNSTQCDDISTALSCFKTTTNCSFWAASTQAQCRYNDCPSCGVVDDFECADGLWCDDPTDSGVGVCKDALDVGDDCDEDDECEPKYNPNNPGYFCDSGKCAKGEYRDNGDDCDADVDCEDGTCTDGVCVGKAKGVACSEDEECDVALYCNSTSGQCATILNLDDACDPSGDFSQCTAFTYCNPTTSKCTLYLQGKVGDDCEATEACEAGLICNSKAVCAVLPSTNKEACNSDSDCDDGTCQCNTITGSPICFTGSIPSSCKNSLIKLQACMYAGGCLNADTTKGSCSANSCSESLLEAYADCVNRLFGDKIIGTICAGWSLQLPFVLVTVLALALLVLL